MKLLKDTRLELWCEALESGKYSPTVGRLCKITKDRGLCYCVLGVALEVYWSLHPDDIEFEIEYENDGSWPYRRYYDSTLGEAKNFYSAWLPERVAEWYGIRPQGQLRRPIRVGTGRLFAQCLDTLNDRGWTQRALAGVIRRGYLERV